MNHTFSEEVKLNEGANDYVPQVTDEGSVDAVMEEPAEGVLDQEDQDHANLVGGLPRHILEGLDGGVVN